MGKTIILNLSDVKLKGDVLDVGENYGIIYSISKEAFDEVSVDVVEGNEINVEVYGEYDTCTMFFCLSKYWREGARAKLIQEVSKLVKVGGEICLWDINKEVGSVFNNKVISVLPSGDTKEFEFKNLNPIIKSNIDDTNKLLSKYYSVIEEKCWEDIFFIRGKKI